MYYPAEQPVVDDMDSQDNNLHLRTTQTLLDELRTLVTSDHVKPCLEHINSLLTNAILKCKTAIDTLVTTSMPQPFSNKENIVPGKNTDHQWKFKKVATSPGRKKLLID